MSYLLDKEQKEIYKENVKTGIDNINQGLSVFWRKDIDDIWEDIKEGFYSIIFLILILLIILFKHLIVRVISFFSARKGNKFTKQIYNTILFNKKRK